MSILTKYKRGLPLQRFLDDTPSALSTSSSFYTDYHRLCVAGTTYISPPYSCIRSRFKSLIGANTSFVPKSVFPSCARWRSRSYINIWWTSLRTWFALRRDDPGFLEDGGAGAEAGLRRMELYDFDSDVLPGRRGRSFCSLGFYLSILSTPQVDLKRYAPIAIEPSLVMLHRPVPGLVVRRGSQSPGAA